MPIEFLRNQQLNIMLFLSGVCSVLFLLVLSTKSISPKRRVSLALLESSAAVLLLADRFAYIYRGDISLLGFWMVRICNFLVFFLILIIIYSFNLFLKSYCINEVNLKQIPKRLNVVNYLIYAGTIFLIISQFTGLYYSFDKYNHYERAPLFALSFIFPFASLALQFSIIIQYYKRIDRFIRVSLIVFTVLPILASIAQIFTYGISIMNISLVGDAIIFYIFAIIDMDKKIENANKHEVEFLKEEQKNMQVLFEQTSDALVSAIDAKDSYTCGHSNRVADYAKKIAEYSGMSEKESVDVYFAALLHDVGKIGVSGEIINKDGKLTIEEYEKIKGHSVIGGQILSRITQSPSLSLGAKYHHERYDGQGYPEGLCGSEIPVIARIIAVADAYDAMTSKRSYRDPLLQQKVKTEIIKGMGTQFDPEYASIMLHLMDLDPDYKMCEKGDTVYKNNILDYQILENSNNQNKKALANIEHEKIADGLDIGDIPNIVLEEWKGQFSVPLLITSQTDLYFHAQSFSSAKYSWHCPYIIISLSKDPSLALTLRLDGKVLNCSNQIGIENRVVKTDEFKDWQTWKSANIKGMDVKVSIRKENNKITVITQNAGIDINCSITINDDVESYVFLSGDQCILSNIKFYN